MRSLAAGPCLLIGVFLAGCARSSGAATAATDPEKIVARVDGAAVTEGELAGEAKGAIAIAERKFAEEVYRERALALDRLIEKRLLASRAKNEGMTADALVDREVKSRVTEPTEAALHAVYDQTKANGRALPPFESVREEIAAFLKGQAADTVKRELTARLRAGARVESLLPPLLLPKVDVPANGPSRGEAGAPVTIVEFSDYECEFCGAAEGTVRRVLDAYPGRVRFVHQPFPLSIHTHAAKAAEAAFCAGEQGRYWEMHDALLSKQGALGVGDLKGRARELKLDAPRFDSCLDSGSMAKAVDASRRLGDEIGVASTPAFFVNGRLLSGAQPFERFKELVDHELADIKP